MIKTLVIILSETREDILTYDNFKKNVLDVLNADLCVCIGIKDDYDYENKYYKNALYKFLYKEPNDFGDAFDEAYKEVLHTEIDEKVIVENNEVLLKPIYWREFLKIKNQFLGGIKDEHNQHPGSAGILIFFRYFLLKNIINNNLINKYDRFIITRSDFIYVLPYPDLIILDEKYIWIPDGESYGGYTDRMAVLSKTNIISYLNILNSFILKSNDYYNKMKISDDWNLEKVIKFHLNEEKIPVKLFPYIMYSIRNNNGSTRWAQGTYNEELGYYIKYDNEYNEAIKNKKEFEESKISINDFYKNIISTKNIIEGFSIIHKKDNTWINILFCILLLFIVIFILKKQLILKKIIKVLHKITINKII
jgi:hypothetical protein